MTIIEKSKSYFLQVIKKMGPDIYHLATHVREMEKWAKKLLKMYPEADQEIVFLAVWMHDIGHYIAATTNKDHAEISEKKAKEFLGKEGYDKEKMRRVLHCIRSHRNKDISPKTLEAKMIVCIDSASHFTWSPYVRMAKNGRADQALGKLERDYRDVGLFFEIKKMIKPLYRKYKKFLEDEINNK